MKVKSKLEMGVTKNKKRLELSLKKVATAAEKAVVPSKYAHTVINSALQGARAAVGKRNVKKPQILPVPSKVRSFLSFLVPVFEGLSAVGTLAGFRGAFMRNETTMIGPQIFESAIVNLDYKDGPGTYWVAYKKIVSDVEYFDFDSFGNLRPPSNLVKYLDIVNIKYNHDRY